MAIFTSPNWSPDPFSILIGFVIGTVLAIVLYKRMSPFVGERWGGIVDWTRTQNDWLGGRAENRFRSEMAQYVMSRHLGNAFASLDQLFVEPRVLVPLGCEAEPTGLNNARKLYHLWPELVSGTAVPPPPSVLAHQLRYLARRVVISGESGTGKSTLLAYLAILAAKSSEGMSDLTSDDKVSRANGSKKNDWNGSKSGNPLAIYVHLAGLDLESFITTQNNEEDPVDPVQPLVNNLGCRFQVLSQRRMKHLILNKAQAGHLCLLIDGYDELPAEARPPVNRWLKKLLAAFPNIQVIVAGSSRDNGPLMKIGFAVTSILDWRQGQAQRAGDSWKAATRSGELCDLSSYWRPGQPAIDTGLRLQLALFPDKNDPVEPPENRLAIFEAILRQLLFRIARDPEGSWLGPASAELWPRLAYTMMSQRVLYLTQDELIKLATLVLEKFETAGERRAINRLVEMMEMSELFVSYGEGRWGFLSPLWRDFLASSYLVRLATHDDLASRMEDSFWSGALHFYATRTGGGGLAAMLLEQKETKLHEQLFILASWLPEIDEQVPWRRQVLVGLGRMIVDQKTPIVWRQRALLALASTGATGVGSLLSHLVAQGEVAIRQILPAAIAKVGEEDALLVIDRLINDGEPVVREAVVHALAWLDDPATERSIIEALLEPDDALSRAAAESLALTAAPESYEILREAIADEVFSVRRAAVAGLVLIEEPWAVELLEKAALKDEQPAVQTAAAEALQIQKSGAVNSTWQAPRPGEQAWLVRWAVAQGRMVPVGDEAMPEVMDALENNDPAIRREAALTLGVFADPDSMSPLVQAYADPERSVRDAAFESLCHLSRAWGLDDDLSFSGGLSPA